MYAPPDANRRCNALHWDDPQTPGAERLSSASDPSLDRRVWLRCPPAEGQRAGGLERYGAWLTVALGQRLHPTGVVFGLRAALGGEVVRLADGVSAAWAEAMGHGPWRRWRHRGWLAREAAAIARARVVVALSPQVAAECARWHGRTPDVVLNPLLPQPPRPAAPPTDLLFIGHGFARKGLDVLLCALARLPDLRLRVVGRDRAIGRFRRLATRLGVHTRVVWAGATPSAAHLAAARLLVHPARYEPYGNVVAEAVAAGVPVVASDRTGAACLLAPEGIWPWESGAEGLAAQIAASMVSPASPRARPPEASTHLAALAPILWP